MTREEAIEILKKYKDESEEDYYVRRAKALGLAIEALEHQKSLEEELEKVRAEIEEQKQDHCFDEDDMFVYITGLNGAIDIIDKYKNELKGKTNDRER